MIQAPKSKFMQYRREKYEIYILRYDPKKKKGGKERGQRTTKTKIYTEIKIL